MKVPTDIDEIALVRYPSYEVYCALRPGWGLEADFGMMWRIGAARACWRVTYVPSSGDLYAVGPHSHRGRDILLLGVNPDPKDLPYPDAYADAERVLSGWDTEEHDCQLGWVAQACQAADWRTPPPRPGGADVRPVRAQLFGARRLGAPLSRRGSA